MKKLLFIILAISLAVPAQAGDHNNTGYWKSPMRLDPTPRDAQPIKPGYVPPFVEIPQQNIFDKNYYPQKIPVPERK